MSNAGGTGDADFLQALYKTGNFPGRFFQADLTVVENSYTTRVVSTVLETMKAF
jgi:hypothetical protein